MVRPHTSCQGSRTTKLSDHPGAKTCRRNPYRGTTPPNANAWFQSCGGRNRTCEKTVNSRLPVPAQTPPQEENTNSVTSYAAHAMTSALKTPMESATPPRQPMQTPGLQKRPAGVEPALPPWQGSRRPLHHGRRGKGLPFSVFAVPLSECRHSAEYARSQHDGPLRSAADRQPRRGKLSPEPKQCRHATRCKRLVCNEAGGIRTLTVRFKRPMCSRYTTTSVIELWVSVLFVPHSFDGVLTSRPGRAHISACCVLDRCHRILC